MIGRKGSQVEVILSFIIFITFLIFLFIIIRPSFQPSDKEFLLDELERNIIERTTGELILSSVRIPDSFLGSCFIIRAKVNNPSYNAIVIDNDGLKAAAEYNAPMIKIERNDNQNFFNMRFSEGLNNESVDEPSCPNINDSQLDFGLTKSFDFVTLYNLDSFRADYLNNYYIIKEELGFAIDSDFAFDFRDSAGNIIIYNNQEIKGIRDEQIGGSVEIFAKDISVQYIDKEGEINQGWLHLEVW